MTSPAIDELPPEIHLIAVSDYLQALDYQRYSNQVVAMLGGKTPHIQNIVSAASPTPRETRS